MLRIERLPETFDEFLMLQTLELVGNPILTKMHLQMNQKSGLVWVYRMLLGYVGWSNIPCDFCASRLFDHFCLMYFDIGNSFRPVAVSNRKITLINLSEDSNWQSTTFTFLLGEGTSQHLCIYVHVWLLSSFLQHLLQMARRDCWFMSRHKDDLWGGEAATQFCG